MTVGSRPSGSVDVKGGLRRQIEDSFATRSGYDLTSGARLRRPGSGPRRRLRRRGGSYAQIAGRVTGAALGAPRITGCVACSLRDRASGPAPYPTYDFRPESRLTTFPRSPGCARCARGSPECARGRFGTPTANGRRCRLALRDDSAECRGGGDAERVVSPALVPGPRTPVPRLVTQGARRIGAGHCKTRRNPCASAASVVPVDGGRRGIWWTRSRGAVARCW